MWRFGFLLILLHNCHQNFADDAEGAKLYPVDETNLEAQKTKVCKTVKGIFDPTATGLPWSETLGQEQIFELALLNLGRGLSSDAVSHTNMDFGWKKHLVDALVYIAHETCATPAISSSYFNIVKNIFLYYLESRVKASIPYAGVPEGAEEDAARNKTSEAQWGEILEALNNCANEVEPMPITEDCGVVNTFQDHAGNWQPFQVIEEHFDAVSGGSLDIIIDSIWWMFSTTYARCYAHFYPNEDVMLLFLQRFEDDMMVDFHNRWAGAAGFMQHFPIVFGTLDPLEEHENLRKCATAAFDLEGLGGRQLVRPVIVDVNGVAMKNFKL